MAPTSNTSVLVVPRSEIARIGLAATGLRVDADAADRFCKVVRQKGRLMSRRLAERDSSVVQPIPLACVQHDRMLLALPGDDRERGDRLLDCYALWVGGHVEDQDRSTGDPVAACLSRELREELSTLPLPTPELVGLVSDQRSSRSRQHIGIVHHIVVDDLATARALAEPPNREHRGCARTVLIDPEQLAIHSWEPWSQFLLDEADRWCAPRLAITAAASGGARG
jgi:predicted NUDIX family phosphoesterase